MHKLPTCSLVTSLVIAVSAPAQGAEEDGPTLGISGFVDGSVVVPIAGYGDADEVVFGLDQVEVDLEATPTGDIALRADVQFLPAVGMPTVDDLLEQGFFDYSVGGSGFFQMGKRNAPIGAESLDPVDMYQFSAGQLFVNATPTNLTGFFGGYRSDTLLAMAWVTNAWDTPSSPRSATPGARLAYTLDAGTIGVSTTFGPVVADDPYAMVDVDASLGFGDLTLLGEVNLGFSDARDVMGALVTANYAISDVVSATLRADYLRTEMTVSETVEDTTVTVEEELSQISLTAAGLFAVADNCGVLAELRTDLPDGADPALTGAVEFTAFW